MATPEENAALIADIEGLCDRLTAQANDLQKAVGLLVLFMAGFNRRPPDAPPIAPDDGDGDPEP